MQKQTIGILVILVIAVILVLPGLGLFSTLSFGDFDVARDCATATAQNTYGAQQGECFLAGISGDTHIAYVESVVQREGTCSISPNCPDGKTYSCQIRSNLNWADIFTCDVVHTGGENIKVCKYDSDCPNGKCTNAMCQGYSSDCSNVGETRCISAKNYEKCQSNLHYSGLLTCASGTTCYIDRCRTPSEISDYNNPNNDGSDGNEPAIPTQTIIIGGVGLLAAIILSKLGN